MAKTSDPQPPSETAIGVGALLALGLIGLAILAKVQASTGRGMF